MIQNVIDEDILIKIKLKSYKKNIRNFILSSFLLIVSYLFVDTFSIFIFVGVIAGIIWLSSFFGVYYNFIPKHVRKYINS